MKLQPSKDLTQFSIVFPANANFEEVVDTIADGAEIVDIVEDRLEDGAGLDDLSALFQVEPLFREIWRDAKVFLDGFLALDAQTSVAAVIAAKAEVEKRRQGNIGKYSRIFLNALFVIANSYSFGLSTYGNAINNFNMWKSLVSGQPVFPDEGFEMVVVKKIKLEN